MNKHKKNEWEQIGEELHAEIDRFKAHQYPHDFSISILSCLNSIDKKMNKLLTLKEVPEEPKNSIEDFELQEGTVYFYLEGRDIRHSIWGTDLMNFQRVNLNNFNLDMVPIIHELDMKLLRGKFAKWKMINIPDYIPFGSDCMPTYYPMYDDDRKILIALNTKGTRIDEDVFCFASADMLWQCMREIGLKKIATTKFKKNLHPPYDLEESANMSWEYKMPF